MGELKIIKRYSVKALCSECGEFLMESNEKTKEELIRDWTNLIISAPLNAPKCPKCNYSTERDCNSGLDFKIKITTTEEDMSEGIFSELSEEITSEEFFKK